jgi:hypothetical protein
MGWSPRAVISPQVAWSAATTFIALRVSYRAAVRVGQAGPCCSLFFGTSPPRSLLPSSTPLFALPLSLILYFPFPSADTSTTLIVLTVRVSRVLPHSPVIHDGYVLFQREYQRIRFRRHCPLMFTLLYVCFFLSDIVNMFSAGTRSSLSETSSCVRCLIRCVINSI